MCNSTQDIAKPGKRNLCLLLFFCLLPFCLGARAKEPQAISEIPIERCDLLPIVKVRIDGVDMRFLLDTAATSMLNLQHCHCVLRILRVPVFVEMEPILEMDAVNGIREPKHGRRLSDPRIDDRLAYCDISYRYSRSPIPRSRRSLRWARESRRAPGNESIQPFLEEYSHLPLLLLFLQPQVTKGVQSPVTS